MANPAKKIIPDLTDKEKEDFYQYCSKKLMPNPENEPISFLYQLNLWYYFKNRNKLKYG
jgi:hypothetical protein